MRKTLIPLLLIAGSLLIGCVPQTREASPPYWPTQGWRISTPEAQGVDSVKLAQGLQAIRQKNLDIHSLMLIRDGMVILDAYFYPYDGKTVHELASVTKSLTTTLIAIAADQGKLKLDDPMLSFFSDRTIANRDARKERITVRNLTSMSSGLSCTAANDEQTLSEMTASPDFVQFTLDRKMEFEPGTVFVYCSPGMHLLSAILQKATGMTELEFARQYLFKPLGIRDAFWDLDPQGFNHGWGDVFLHPRDAAKLGYLWMNKGVWEGQQIVPRDWVEASVKTQIKTGGDDDYGYGWWIVGKDGEYAAVGRGGQRIQVWPALNMMLVMTAGGAEIDDLEPLIAPALVDPSKPLPANPAGVSRLNETLSSITQAPAAKAVPSLPETARVISGKTFAFEPNPFQIKSLSLVFDASAEASLDMGFANQPNVLAQIGLDGVYRMSPWDYGLLMGQRGTWTDAQTFVLEWDGIANRDAYTLTMHFEGDRVSVIAKERTRGDSVKLEGRVQNP
jgi:CubicO group peptidase (beta-lactamase class C family)